VPYRTGSMKTATSIAAGVLLLAAACGNGGSPSTAQAASASPTAIRASSSRYCPYGSELSGGYLPSIIVTPDTAAIGSTVQVSGEHFSGRCWPYHAGPETIFLFGPDGPPGCELVAELDGAATVARDGTVTGSFTVPARGFCRMDVHNPPRQPRLVPGRYSVSLGCTACAVGEFTVTKS
jgi:hypothetical protein